jgi:L-glyceraldehyde 3-phosphate reductase
MALAWVLRDRRVTSALIGASRPEQLLDNVEAARNTTFSAEELQKIDRILAQVTMPESLWDHE